MPPGVTCGSRVIQRVKKLKSTPCSTPPLRTAWSPRASHRSSVFAAVACFRVAPCAPHLVCLEHSGTRVGDFTCTRVCTGAAGDRLLRLLCPALIGASPRKHGRILAERLGEIMPSRMQEPDAGAHTSLPGWWQARPFPFH